MHKIFPILSKRAAICCVYIVSYNKNFYAYILAGQNSLMKHSNYPVSLIGNDNLEPIIIKNIFIGC
jgi:hypothetical protein